jgi:hypothetical protein
VTQVTPDELRTVQQHDDKFPINRDRLSTLEAIGAGRIRRTDSGFDVLSPKYVTGGGFGSRVGAKVRLLWAAGLVVLDTHDTYQLTNPGVRVTAATRAALLANSVTAGK